MIENYVGRFAKGLVQSHDWAVPIILIAQIHKTRREADPAKGTHRLIVCHMMSGIITHAHKGYC